MPSLTVDQRVIHYTERGNGNNAIVLLHGFPLDCRVWDKVLVNPPAGWRIITPDLPGFGQSQPTRPFTMESAAKDLHALLERIGALPCVLGGLSMGGYVALAYAKSCPMKLRGLMLIDTRAEADTAEGRGKRDAMIQLARQKGSAAVAMQMLPNMTAKSADPKVIAAIRGIMESCPAITIEHALAAMRDREDHVDFLPSISEPSLILVGTDDAITPVASAQMMQGKISRSKLVTIAGAGHTSPMEKPAEVSRAIEEFVASIA